MRRWFLSFALTVLVSCSPAGPSTRSHGYRFDWVRMAGGAFEMGAPPGAGDTDEHPRHTVELGSFEIMRTEATVAQYDRCVQEGACLDPETREDIPPTDWCLAGEPDTPRGCLDWAMAADFCDWAGGVLPSEARWEYAARSLGKDHEFPWGDGEPTCDLAVLGYTAGDPCGEDGAAVVCSRPGGDTEQGLCDMAGNIYEWVQDWHHDDYTDAPTDGTAWDDPPDEFRVLRGGGINSDEPVRTTNRTYHEPEFTYSGSGVRCTRELVE